MATYKVKFSKEVFVDEVTNENMAVMVASMKKNIPTDFSVEEIEFISE